MTIPPMSKEQNFEKAKKISELIGSYRLLTKDDKFESKGIKKLNENIRKALNQNQPIQIVLPAFAFKSPNIQKKTLGNLPDKAEEIALSHLQGLAENIFRIYDKGAIITIISDGLVYSDLLGVDDQIVFEYGQALREMANNLAVDHIRFSRISDLLGFSDIETKEDYATQAPIIRQMLFKKYASVTEDNEIKQKINEKEEISDVKRTFQSYQSILAEDLEDMDNDRREEINFEMLKRGKCFSSLIADKVPHHVRLSIHPSENVEKISISLIVSTTYNNSKDLIIVNPWHGCIVQYADGSWKMTSRNQIDENKFEICLKNGKPWLLIEKSDIFSWKGMNLIFEPLYPCGILITPTNIKEDQPQFENVEMDKIRSLTLFNSPILLRGFKMEVRKETFRLKAKELGEIVMWPFGDILEVRENSEMNMNNVLTNESMPFHYDGVFVTIKDKNGKPKSNPPLFQMFRNKSSEMKGGLTLFSSSRNLIPLLQDDEIKFEKIKNIQWETFTSSNDAFGGDNLILPLFIDHPISGQTTFRFHEPWPKSKTTNCNPTLVKLIGYSEEKSDSICGKLTDLLYDHRSCFYHSWQAGDFVFNDNMTTHHTRTAFKGGSREHWRVHVN